MLAGVLAAYANHALFAPDAFARRVADSFQDERVASYVAGQLTDAIITEEPDLIAVRPVLLAGVQALIETDAFRAIVRRGAREAHRSVLGGTTGTLVVSLPDFNALLRSAVATNPALAERLPPSLTLEARRLSELPLSGAAARLIRLARASALFAIAVLALGGLVTLAGVLLAPSRRRAVLRVGETWLGLAAVLLALPTVGGAIVQALVESPLGGPARGLWGAFTGDLRTVGWAVASVALGLVAAVSSLEELPDLRAGLDRLGRWVAVPPGGRAGKALRGAALLALGTAAVLQPIVAAEALALVLGALLAFLGLRELFALALPRAIGEVRATPSGGRHTALRIGVAAAAVVSLAIGVLVALGPERVPLGRPRRCNGSDALCARRLDQVVFPGTHNSMAAADVSEWYMPNQERGISTQLEDGVRALLIDVMPGIAVGDQVRTELASESAARAKYVSVIGEEGVDAALRIRDRLVPGEGARQLFSCHGFCELGAIPLAEVFETVRKFLADHPGEVLLVIVQDEGVTAGELAAVAESVGLAAYAYRGPFAAPWPTLRQLVDADTRLLLFVEHDRGGEVPWIPNAYEVFQETPYDPPAPEAMSCAQNRGDASNPLFLLNHFVAGVPPLPSVAARVNSREFLVARARRCWEARGRVPTIVAVDFYGTGDLIEAARELNGLAP